MEGLAYGASKATTLAPRAIVAVQNAVTSAAKRTSSKKKLKVYHRNPPVCRCPCWKRYYEPYDDLRGKTDVIEYRPKLIYRIFDRMGDRNIFTSPSALPQTGMGSIVSIAALLLLLILFINAMVKLIGGDRVTSADEPIVLNLDCVNTNGHTDSCEIDLSSLNLWDRMTYELGFGSGGWMDFPALNLTIRSTIEFYEADGLTTLQKIRMVDRTRLFPDLVSSTEGIEHAIGVTDSVAVPLNTYHPSSGLIPPEQEFEPRSLSDMQGAGIAHSFQESLKFFYARNNILTDNTKTYFDHDLYTFVRFDSKQLRMAKSCQVQLSVANAIQFRVLEEALKGNREYFNEEYLSSFATSNVSWAPSNWDSSTHQWKTTNQDNLVLISSSLTKVDKETFANSTALGPDRVNVPSQISSLGLDDESWLDWLFFVGYVNNFNYTVQSTLCDGRSPNYAFAFASPPNQTDTELQLTKARIPRHKTPFFVLVTGDVGYEKMLVTNVSSDRMTWTVQRDWGALNFAVARPLNIPPFPPSTWQCHPNKYNDRKACDCNCGAADPDCFSRQQDVKNCASGEQCSPLGRCTRFVYTEGSVAVSETCTHLMLPGETTLVGFFSENATLDECTRATGDADGRPVLYQFSDIIEDLNSNLTATEGEKSLIQVRLGAKAAFPTKVPYLVALDPDQGNEEFVHVVHASEPDASNYQNLTIQAITGSSFRQNHFAAGHVVSAFSDDFQDIIVWLEENTPFPETGPFSVQVDSTEFDILSASTGDGKSLQALNINVKPPLRAGYTGITVRKAVANVIPTGVTFLDFAGGWVDSQPEDECLPDYERTTTPTPPGPPGAQEGCDGLHDGWIVIDAVGMGNMDMNGTFLLIRYSGGIGTRGMELRQIEKVYQWQWPMMNGGSLIYLTPEWKCDPSLFLDDLCHCGCGRFDPDCGGPEGRPQAFAQRLSMFVDKEEISQWARIQCDDPDRIIMTGTLGPVTCAELRANHSVAFRYCQAVTGEPTDQQMDMHVPDVGLGPIGSYFTNPDGTLTYYHRKLWEVIEIHEPVRQDREAGTRVETIAINTHMTTDEFEKAYDTGYLDETRDQSGMATRRLLYPSSVTDTPSESAHQAHRRLSTMAAPVDYEMMYTAVSSASEPFGRQHLWRRLQQPPAPREGDHINPTEAPIDEQEHIQPPADPTKSPRHAPNEPQTDDKELYAFAQPPTGAPQDTTSDCSRLCQTEVDECVGADMTKDQCRSMLEEGGLLQQCGSQFETCWERAQPHDIEEGDDPCSQDPDLCEALGIPDECLGGGRCDVAGGIDNPCSDERQVFNPRTTKCALFCDLNQIPTLDRICAVDERATQNPSTPVSDRLHFEGIEYFDVLANYDTFTTALKKDIAAVANISLSRISIDALVEGSVQVTFTYLPYSGPGSAADYKTPTGIKAMMDARRPYLYAFTTTTYLKDADPWFGTSAPGPPSSGSEMIDFESITESLMQSEADKIPDVTVVSDEIFTLSEVSLIRSEEDEYLPEHRYLPNYYEATESPAVLDLQLATFLTPKRKEPSVKLLCPHMAVSPADSDAAANTTIISTGCSKDRNTPFRQDNEYDRDVNAYGYLAGEGTPQQFWGKWKILDGFQWYVRESSCKSAMFDECNCAEFDNLPTGHYRLTCNKVIYPTRVFQYEAGIPLNHKWVFPSSRTESIQHKPEYELDFHTDYFFTFDQSVLEAERSFKASARPGGDIYQGSRVVWIGEPFIKGFLFCDTNQGTALEREEALKVCGQRVGTDTYQNYTIPPPANPPTATLDLMLRINKKRTKELVDKFRPKHWPRSDSRHYKELIESIDKFSMDIRHAISSISSAEDRSIPLVPGTQYFIVIYLDLYPIYEKNVLGRSRLKSWTVSVSDVTGTTVPLDYANRYQNQVRIAVHINSNRRLIEKQNYDIPSFLSDLGAWMGIWAIAIAVLFSWQLIFKPFGNISPMEADDRYEHKWKKQEEAHSKRVLKLRENAFKLCDVSLETGDNTQTNANAAAPAQAQPASQPQPADTSAPTDQQQQQPDVTYQLQELGKALNLPPGGQAIVVVHQTHPAPTPAPAPPAAAPSASDPGPPDSQNKEAEQGEKVSRDAPDGPGQDSIEMAIRDFRLDTAGGGGGGGEVGASVPLPGAVDRHDTESGGR
ncbi:unnamed protein product [Vitrella brassicaformis CCMP3155]|uniref:Uncharacterized protein n=4 Tax=Vitrella brassicaformis TaxID=1169539 RepID=A0A0G4EW29_VITBC|nr:unnamed protein product [Vitrella brassicaformis CCMP3155]|eukprot:CEM02545.1 unnamed protein product [Vitrella brassicaformis CCMP3155]